MLRRVINCNKHKARLAKFVKSAKAHFGGAFVRVPCVDGRTLDVCSLVDEGKLSRRADMTPIEVAICLSHRKCWEALVKSKQDYMLVCEDDTTF